MAEYKLNGAHVLTLENEEIVDLNDKKIIIDTCVEIVTWVNCSPATLQ